LAKEPKRSGSRVELKSAMRGGDSNASGESGELLTRLDISLNKGGKEISNDWKKRGGNKGLGRRRWRVAAYFNSGLKKMTQVLRFCGISQKGGKGPTEGGPAISKKKQIRPGPKCLQNESSKPRYRKTEESQA